ncbi:MAG TPA: YggS family pyridoxal phosphate-dependent enzyme [Flavobacteriaceae bacterium]|nr:YggS family pyridoxal phosphate-dependent enzyme [Flavobacteriaceae bacterium]
MIKNILHSIKSSIPDYVTLVAVSKTKPPEDILEAYKTGHRIFGENKVQELVEKYEILPKDIEWHMIGHLQRNKVKYIASFVQLIHGVDSLKLLKEINKQAQKNNRIIHCLLQVKIAKEDSKYGLSAANVKSLLESPEVSQLKNIYIEGLMGMATFTENDEQIKKEFTVLASLFDNLKAIHTKNCKLKTLSMGMSGDYKLAITCGSNMIRLGSTIFGERN